MARTYQNVMALKTKQLESEVQGLPPGYIAGGGLTLVENGGTYYVDIDPLIINIKGKRVAYEATYTIVDGDFVGNKLGGYWYYIYIDDAANFHVDVLAPTYDVDFNAYYHPSISNYRSIGRTYIDGDGNYEVCTPKLTSGPSWGEFYEKITNDFVSSPPTSTAAVVATLSAGYPEGINGIWGRVIIGAPTAGEYFFIKDMSNVNWQVFRTQAAGVTISGTFKVPVNDDKQFKYKIDDTTMTTTIMYIYGYYL